ncbi:unnamed protein product [Victoria cruziana]
MRSFLGDYYQIVGETQGLYIFDMEHFEDVVRIGEWEKAERCLSSFRKVDYNCCPMKMFEAKAAQGPRIGKAKEKPL